MNPLRHPLFGAGIVLLVLGIGNWSMGHSKVAEYTSSLNSHDKAGTTGNFEEFSELDARTNAALLQSLHRGMDDYVVVDAKLDFYKVVQTGGQLFALAGMGLVIIASAGAWRRARAPSVINPH